MDEWSDIIRMMTDEYAENMKQCEAQKKQLRKDHCDAMLRLIGDQDGSELQAHFASLVYVMDKNVSGASLMSFLGSDKEHFQSTLLRPVFVLYTCSKCGEKFRHHLGARTSIKYDSYGRVVSADYTPTHCEDCSAKQASINRRNQDACQVKRRVEVNNLKTMPYSEYLKTEHWQDTRKRALKRARFKCELCNSNGQLHVHHRTYDNRGEERSADLIVLCAACHAKFHDKDHSHE